MFEVKNYTIIAITKNIGHKITEIENIVVSLEIVVEAFERLSVNSINIYKDIDSNLSSISEKINKCKTEN